jgi:hypothetical protein
MAVQGVQAPAAQQTLTKLGLREQPEREAQPGMEVHPDATTQCTKPGHLLGRVERLVHEEGGHHPSDHRVWDRWNLRQMHARVETAIDRCKVASHDLYLHRGKGEARVHMQNHQIYQAEHE